MDACGFDNPLINLTKWMAVVFVWTSFQSAYVTHSSNLYFHSILSHYLSNDKNVHKAMSSVQCVSSDSFVFAQLVPGLPDVFLCIPACLTSTFPIDHSPSLFPQCHLSFFHYLSPISCAVFVSGDAGMSVWADSEGILQHVRQVKNIKNTTRTAGHYLPIK